VEDIGGGGDFRDCLIGRVSRVSCAGLVSRLRFCTLASFVGDGLDFVSICWKAPGNVGLSGSGMTV
jgi:hypothetical protein